MEELLGAILGAIFEVIGEFLLELVLAALAGLLSRAFRRFRVTMRRSGPVASTLIFIMVGLAFGLLSTWIFPHPLVAPVEIPRDQPVD